MNILTLFILLIVQLSTSIVNCLLTYYCNLDTQNLLTNELNIENIENIKNISENYKYNCDNKNLNENFINYKTEVDM